VTDATAPVAPVRARGRLRWERARLDAANWENARYRTLELAVDGWPGHRPGQHVDVRLTADDGYQAQRSYSIASAPAAGRLAITVERIDDGEVSPYLTEELRPRDQIELRGPVGGYFVWEPELGGPLLLVAGGSGVAPLMSMLRQRAAVGSRVPVRLLLSSRTVDDILYRGELERLAAADPSLDVVHTLTRQQPPGWTGYARRIDDELLAEVGWPPAERPLVYVCGPTRLVEDVARRLVEQGHEPGRVRTERFGPTGA
jgi:ferredoxin-NADP reductase